MADHKHAFAVYASKSIAPPADEYWAQRRRVAALFKALQERVQTTAFSTGQLQDLGDSLQTLSQSMGEAPQLLGRSAWTHGGRFGDWSLFQTETTPILGPSNPISPGLSIWFEDGKALASVTFNWLYEGADHIVHGGWVAAVFDEFLGTAQVLSGKTGMTGVLTTSFHKPTPIGQELQLEARVKSVEERKVTMIGEMRAGDTVTASCEGIFVIPQKKISQAFG